MPRTTHARYLPALRLGAGLAAIVAAPLAANAQQPAATPRTAPLSIARALAAPRPEADTVTIAGRATASQGQLQRSALEISIDDGTGAVRVFSRSLDVPVRAGDSVLASGSVRSYRGSLELFATSVRVVPGPSRTVAPIPVTLAGPITGAIEGRLVTVQGAVTAYGRSEGGEWLRLRGTHASDAGSLTVWVHANHGGGVRLSRVKDADSIRVTGIVVAFQDNPEDPLVWQIIPRTAPDVAMLGGRSWRGGITRIGLAVVAALTLLLIAMRIGARRHATALRETEDRYRQLLELSPDAVIVHEGGRVRFANPAAATMLGVDGEGALVGRELSTFVDAESRGLFAAEAPAPAGAGDDASNPEAVRRARGRVRTCGGGELDVEVTTSPCRYHDRPATVVLARDITQELRVERDLRSLALLDDLTGLHNRRGFMLFAEQELTRARRYGRETALVFADLDDLKAVNDEHGHAAGDLALRAMANALRSVLRESDIVARWSGDEFVALLLESSAAHAPQFAERLRIALESQSLSLPFVVRASVGTATIDDAIADALERADAALYQAKSEKRQG